MDTHLKSKAKFQTIGTPSVRMNTTRGRHFNLTTHKHTSTIRVHVLCICYHMVMVKSKFTCVTCNLESNHMSCECKLCVCSTRSFLQQLHSSDWKIWLQSNISDFGIVSYSPQTPFCMIWFDISWLLNMIPMFAHTHVLQLWKHC